MKALKIGDKVKTATGRQVWTIIGIEGTLAHLRQPDFGRTCKRDVSELRLIEAGTGTAEEPRTESPKAKAESNPNTDEATKAAYEEVARAYAELERVKAELDQARRELRQSNRDRDDARNEAAEWMKACHEEQSRPRASAGSSSNLEVILSSWYRKVTAQYHPDRGGDGDTFARMNDIREDLLGRLRASGMIA